MKSLESTTASCFVVVVSCTIHVPVLLLAPVPVRAFNDDIELNFMPCGRVGTKETWCEIANMRLSCASFDSLRSFPPPKYE